MCCFSRPVDFVAGTKIFARALADGSQYLAYAMNFAAASELAMILPLPVPPASAEDAVEFINLHGYPGFFTDMRAAFPVQTVISRSGASPLFAGQGAPTLEVHDVGSFEASFVPTVEDFSRLDDRFRLPANVWEDLPAYGDWGFGVFKLKPQSKSKPWWRQWFGTAARGGQTIHPIAFRFPRRDPQTLFFPTVHIHDGEVHDTAHFDHELYCQPDAVTAATFGWEASSEPIGQFVDAERAGGLIDPERPCYRTTLTGNLPNHDTTLVPPAGIEPAALHYRDDVFYLRVQLRTAYVHGVPGRYASVDFQRTAREHAPELSDFLRSALADLFDSHRREWNLTGYDEASLLCIDRGDQVAIPGLDEQAPPRNGPVRVRFEIGVEQIEPQQIEVMFGDVPQAARLEAVRRAVRDTLDSAPWL